MQNDKTVLITGASGNLGRKLRQHLEGRYPLRLLDIDPSGDPAIQQADFSRWDESWAGQFDGVHTVVHMAADPTANQSWAEVIGPNIDGLINVFTVAVRAGVKRLVYASSNHVMGGYKALEQPERLTTDIPPRPGTHYVVGGEPRDSTPYGAAKLMGERLGKCYADIYGMSVVAVRIGAIRPGANRPEDFPPDREAWFRLMWLSNRDYCQLMERCIEADPAIRFAVVNGMSANSGMRWDIDYTRDLLGYEAQDDINRG